MSDREPGSGEPGPAGVGAPPRPAGSLSLELALAVPAVFLLLLLVAHATVLARDALLVQAAAREGARVAATTTDDQLVRDAVSEAMGDRDVEVTVTERRAAGQVLRVTVIYRSAAGRTRPRLTAEATAAVEPGVVASRRGVRPGTP